MHAPSHATRCANGRVITHAKQVFKQVSPSVVVVITYDAAGKPIELGSGVVLPDGSVATNCHVLKDGTQYRVRYQDKDSAARLDKSDWDHDVCSLSVPGLTAPPVVLGNTKMLQVGAPVYAIGTPEGLQLTLSEGIVSSLRPVGGGSYIQTTAAISPGSSGGGLFDDQGRLLGLTSFYVSEGQQLNFALPVEWIESLPQRSSPRVAGVTSEVDWLNRAVALKTKKDWSELVALGERWTKASPSSGNAWAVLGDAYDNSGQYAQAIDAFRQLLRITPQDAKAWTLLGITYTLAAQYAQAIDTFHQLLQIHPQDADAWYGLGRAYHDLHQYAQAIDAYRHALRINPRNAQGWFGLGLAYYYANQDAQAIDAYHQALRINSRDLGAWLNLGIAYDDAGQHSQAIDAYRQALLINPQDAKVWFNLGITYDLTGQKDQALAVYQHLKTLSPELAIKLFDVIVPQ